LIHPPSLEDGTIADSKASWDSGDHLLDILDDGLAVRLVEELFGHGVGCDGVVALVDDLAVRDALGHLRLGLDDEDVFDHVLFDCLGAQL